MKLFGWFRRSPPPLAIPQYRVPPVIDIKPLEPKDAGITVTEEELTSTGLWRLFPHKKPPEK